MRFINLLAMLMLVIVILVLFTLTKDLQDLQSTLWHSLNSEGNSIYFAESEFLQRLRYNMSSKRRYITLLTIFQLMLVNLIWCFNSPFSKKSTLAASFVSVSIFLILLGTW